MAARLMTFGFIKPDAVRAQNIGGILKMAEAYGLIIEWISMAWIGPSQARSLYEEHVGQPFFKDLIAFTCDGPSILLLLSAHEGDDPVVRWRELIGATNPAKAAPWTIRARFGKGGPANAVHGSATRVDVVRELRIFGLDEQLAGLVPGFEIDLGTAVSSSALLR